MTGGRAIIGQFGKQVVWSTTARAISALLQLAVIVLLARSLVPAKFAFASTTYSVLMVMVALNGFGILRQIDYRLSLDPTDPAIPRLFTIRLRYTYFSGLVWALVCIVLWMATRDSRYLIIVPAAIWLIIEQITQLWNSISIVEGKSQLLIRSYVSRRLPVVISLGIGLVFGFDGLACMVAGMVAGGFASYVQGWSTQADWARELSPRLTASHGPRVEIDVPFWLSELGDQIRDLDVPVVALVSTATAGIYALPARLVRPMNLVTSAGAMVAFPHIVRMDAISRRQLCGAVAAGSIPVFAASAACYFAAPLLPIVAGESYRSSIPVLQVMAWTAFVAGPSILLCNFLQARTEKALRDSGLIMLLGNIFLLPCVLLGAFGKGAVGAAFGALAGQVLILLLLFLRGLAECGTRPHKPSELGEAFIAKESEGTV